ncbi:MAG: hypothetical protein PHG21_14860, partial [Azoarcus sp.]|nr:hypothetical protein [Azoarcus sp.]
MLYRAPGKLQASAIARVASLQGYTCETRFHIAKKHFQSMAFSGKWDPWHNARLSPAADYPVIFRMPYCR